MNEIIYYSIKNPEGETKLSYLSNSTIKSIENFLASNIKYENWKEVYKLGYRRVKIKIETI